MTAWSSNAQHPWSLDEAVGHAGATPCASVRKPSGNVMVMTETDRLKPGERYVIDAWWRTEGVVPTRVDCIIFRDAAGARLTGDDIYPMLDRGEWFERYRIIPPERTVSATVGFWVRGHRHFLISDLRSGPFLGERTYPRWATMIRRGHPGPVRRGVQQLKETDCPSAAGERWNQLLFKIASGRKTSRTRRHPLPGALAGSLGTHGRR